MFGFSIFSNILTSKQNSKFMQGAWKPSWNVSTVLKSIQSLMAEPNPEDPLMGEIVSVFTPLHQPLSCFMFSLTVTHIWDVNFFKLLCDLVCMKN